MDSSGLLRIIVESQGFQWIPKDSWMPSIPFDSFGVLVFHLESAYTDSQLLVHDVGPAIFHWKSAKAVSQDSEICCFPIGNT